MDRKTRKKVQCSSRGVVETVHQLQDGSACSRLNLSLEGLPQPSPSPDDGDRHSAADMAIGLVSPSSTLCDETGLNRGASASKVMPVSSPLIESIREAHRQRQDLHRAEKSLTLQCKAICRRLSEGDKKIGAKLFDEAAADESHAVHCLLAPYLEARKIIQCRRAEKEKQLESWVKMLPIAEYVNSVKGLGLGSLAALIGECGDLSNYSTHSKLWKRMGLAPYNGKAPSTWRMLSGKRGGASAEDWKIMGYSPIRRSISWNIGQCVLKAQSARIDKETGEIKKPAGPYRTLYDNRKEYEKSKPDVTPMIVNCRALRYMEKRVLRDIWQQWRNNFCVAGPKIDP